MFAEAYDLGASTPLSYGNALSDVAPNEAFLSRSTGGSAAVYMPRGGEVVLALAGAPGGHILRWLDIEKSEWLDPVSGIGSNAVIKTPDARPWLVLLSPEVVR